MRNVLIFGGGIAGQKAGEFALDISERVTIMQRALQRFGLGGVRIAP